MSWQKRFTFRDKTFVEHEVNGTSFKFYPNRMALLSEARDLSGPVSKALNTLFADQSRDTASKVRRQEEDGSFRMEDISTEAISIDMARYRAEQRDKAVETLMGTLADPRSLLLLGRLFMDSLREEFPYMVERPASQVEEFLYGDSDSEYQGLDLPTLMGLFNGWMKANAKVFGSSGESLVGLVKAKIEGLTADSDLEMLDPTSGEPSKTPSSLRLVTDSQPSTSND